jgi:hypothetical protein
MTSTTKAPAKTTAKKAAPAKAAPAKKAVATEAAPKIRWTLNGERDANGNRPAVGACGDMEYRIDGSGDAWKATVKIGTKTTVIAEGVSGKAAWSACVKHSKTTTAATAA